MLSALMVGEDIQACETIRHTMHQHCRDIAFKGMTIEPSRIWLGDQGPDLVFWDEGSHAATRHLLEGSLPLGHMNLMLVQGGSEPRQPWGSMHVCLRKPLLEQELLRAIAQSRIMVEMRRSLETHQRLLDKLMMRQPMGALVGIPTEDGMEFLPPNTLLRCEGVNKYTLIQTCDGSQMISSYNIGEFAKLLQHHGFFAPHRSHLINLAHIRKLTLDNLIILTDGSQVPLSRRRRQEFVDLFKFPTN
jgi:two-component system, LytTR family, response regulator